MKSQKFSFKCKKEVSQKTLKRIWDQIREDLRTKGYSVKDIEMPKVQAFVLSPKRFIKVGRELKESPHVRDKSTEEYGEKVNLEESSAFLVFIDTIETWFILKCEGRYSVKRDLDHELRHLFERALGLKIGILAH